MDTRAKIYFVDVLNKHCPSRWCKGLGENFNSCQEGGDREESRVVSLDHSWRRAAIDPSLWKDWPAKYLGRMHPQKEAGGQPSRRQTLSNNWKQMWRLVYKVKHVEKWTNIFELLCYPTEYPDDEYGGDEIDRYVEIINTHVRVQESYNSTPSLA